MDPPRVKPNQLKNILIRLFSVGVIIFAIRFAFLVTLKGRSCNPGDDFCFSRRLSHPSSSSHLVVPPRKSRKLINYYSSIFQDLIAQGFLTPTSKSLCIGTQNGEDVLALRKIGVRDTIGISKKPSSPFIISGDAHLQPFTNNTFDFLFSGEGRLDRSKKPVEFVSEIARTLKPGGFLAVHSKSKDSYSLNSFLDLFNCCKVVKIREISGPSSSTIREIVMKRGNLLHKKSVNVNSGDICYVPGVKRKVLVQAEPLIEQEPVKPWVKLKRNVKYFSSMVDISFKRRYIYIDVGAGNYTSSVGWFRKQYPKQNKSFQIYAIEADKAFHRDYFAKKGVSLLPYAAWVRNETLFFGITRKPTRKIPEKIKSSVGFVSNYDRIVGFDLAEWLSTAVGDRDFVVMKMQVKGTEFHLIRRMIETGTICLVEEMFLKCHYDKSCPDWRSKRYYDKTYEQCLDLFKSLRKIGVLVHQWW